MSLSDDLNACSRFLGIDLQYRRNTHGRSTGEQTWPKPWRARIVASKNERAECRITVYGDTAEEAAAALRSEMECVESDRP